ncbi:MAG: diaminopimelate decarboxylase [Deltaproteobacteria bacterium]|nr:diaminopimelate decarboxylase [Deltaproteobacteria bacterium]
MDFFNYHNNELFVEDVKVKEIVGEVGTPTFIYSGGYFKEKLGELVKAFSGCRHLICYSVKAAANLALLKIVSDAGLGADIVSGGELFRALKARIPGGRVVFSGVGKTAREMAEALEAGIFMFNLESQEEMELLGKVAQDMGQIAPVAFRVNPDVDPLTHPYIATGLKESKFGIPHGEAVSMYLEAKKISSLKIIGLACHIGSQLTETSPFVEATRVLGDLIGELRIHGISIRYLDVGGGLGITYSTENPPSPQDYAQALVGIIQEHPGVTLIIEPGRSIVGNSCLLVSQVLYNKVTSSRHFVVVDAAMNDLIRPSLYGAHHEIVPVTKNPLAVALQKVSIVGPVCESGDFLAKDRLLPAFNSGDLIAVKGAGAYGFSMSSNYNSRPRAAEVLVGENNFQVIRVRETYEDLVKGEII